VVESPRVSWVVLLADRSAVDTRRRESKVASEVCLTDAKSSLALVSVLIRPFDPGARYSARESYPKSATVLAGSLVRSPTGQFS